MASFSWQTVFRALTWFHRWTSIAVCLLFAMWFASGAVMLFEPFPVLSDQDRLTHGQAIDPQNLLVHPLSVLLAFPKTSALRLIDRAGRAAYVATDDEGVTTIVDAQTSESLPPLDELAARRVAENFAGYTSKHIEPNVTYDQWVVHQGFDSGRPYYRVDLDNESGTTLYVSAMTGEVVQRTTRAQRQLNMVGAVLHWVYFTPIRKHWSFWNQLVWWVSLLALVGAVAGMVLGIYRYVQARRLSGRGFGLFRGWMRWHHMLGIFSGTFLVTWIFSGWLSMDHERLFSPGSANKYQQALFYGQSLRQAVERISIADVRTQATGAIRLHFLSVAGQGFTLAQESSGTARVQITGERLATSVLPDALLLRAARAAWPGAVVVDDPLARTTDFYATAEGVGKEVRRFSISNISRVSISRVSAYVDARSAEIIAVVNDSRRAYAWLYFGLHTFRVPGLAGQDDLRIALMLALLVAGFAMSTTGIVLAYKHLSR